MAMRASPRKRLVDRFVKYAMVAAVAALIAGGLPSRGPARAAGDCTVSPSDTTMDADEQQLLSLINQYRQQKGVGQLSVSASLVRSSAWKARDYATRAFSAGDPHTDSTGRSHHQLNLDCGFRGSVTGENLGSGFSTPQAIFDGWKNSAAHNNNMLRANMVAAGVGRSGSSWALEIGNALDSGTPTTGATQTATTQTATTQTTATPTPAPTVRPTTTGTGAAGTGTTQTATNTATTQTVQQVGYVTFRVRLVDASGREAVGSLAGYAFTLSGVGTVTTTPTDAQGQTTVSVPPGVYALSTVARQGVTGGGFTVGGVPASSITVSPGGTSTVLATNYVSAPVGTTGSGGTTTQQLTGGNGGTGSSTAVPNTSTSGNAAITTTPATSTGTSGATTTTTTQQSSGTTATTATNTTTTTAMQTVQLAAGCTNVALTWAAGTPMSTIVDSLSDEQSLIAIWRHSAEGNRFRAYAPEAARGVSDYLTTEQGVEAVYVCLRSPATLTRPAIG